MALIRLENTVQDRALVEKVCEPSHMQRVEQVDLQEQLISNVITVERHPFDKRDVSNIDRSSVVCIPAIRCS
jgi:hypothetical protein